MFVFNSVGVKRRLEKKTFIFNADSPHFHTNHEYNKLYIINQQNYWNDVLAARGYVFLNDVLVSLGIDRTMIGQLAGWRKDTSGFIKIEIEQTMFKDIGVKEHFLRIEHDGLIIDILND